MDLLYLIYRDLEEFAFSLLRDEWLQRVSGKLRSSRDKLTADKLAKRDRTVVGRVWDASHLSPFKLNKSEQKEIRLRSGIGSAMNCQIGWQ